MALFDTLQPPPPPSKIRRHFYTAVGVIVTIAVFVAAFPSYLWYPFVYYRKKEQSKISRSGDRGEYRPGLSDMEALGILYSSEV